MSYFRTRPKISAKIDIWSRDACDVMTGTRQNSESKQAAMADLFESGTSESDEDTDSDVQLLMDCESEEDEDGDTIADTLPGPYRFEPEDVLEPDDGGLPQPDPGPEVADLYVVVDRRTLPVDQWFVIVYLTYLTYKYYTIYGHPTSVPLP